MKPDFQEERQNKKEYKIDESSVASFQTAEKKIERNYKKQKLQTLHFRSTHSA